MIIENKVLIQENSFILFYIETECSAKNKKVKIVFWSTET